jgi:hypothetical protein
MILENLSDPQMVRGFFIMNDISDILICSLLKKQMDLKNKNEILHLWMVLVN